MQYHHRISYYMLCYQHISHDVISCSTCRYAVYGTQCDAVTTLWLWRDLPAMRVGMVFSC